MASSSDAEAIFAKLETSDYDLSLLSAEEALVLLENQIDGMFKIGADPKSYDLAELGPGGKRGRDESEDLGVPLRSDSKLKYNFEDGPESLDSQLRFKRRQQLVKKFYLKQVPSLATSQYLQRIFKHCSLSTSVILTCSVYLFNLGLGIYHDRQEMVFHDMELQPLNSLNFYRIILTAIRVALKFIEDKNFKSKHYCKIVGLNVKEYPQLELNFMFLIDFRFYVNQIILQDNLKFMKRFNDFVTRKRV